MVFKWIGLGLRIEQGNIFIIVGEVVTCYQWYMYIENLMNIFCYLFSSGLINQKRLKLEKHLVDTKKSKASKSKLVCMFVIH